MAKFKPNNSGLKQSNKFKTEIIEQTFSEKFNHPIFCFRFIHADYNIDKCTDDEKKSLLEQIVRLSSLTWNEITNTQRHGLGSEKIDINSIKPSCPSFITPDVSYLLSIRFQGKKPFIIHRDRFIAHIIFIDNKFSVYNH